MTTGRGEDEAWRAIVDNYGERAELDDVDEAPPADPEPRPVVTPTTIRQR